MDERTPRRLLIISASAVVLQASKRGTQNAWFMGMLARKPRMLVTVALANKMASKVWTLLVRYEDYRVPVSFAA